MLGIFLNAALAIAKVLSGILGNSYVLIADGIESSLDIAGSLVIWGGLTVAAKPPDESHPYGHGKAEPVASIVVSLAVIGAAGVIAFESIREILSPHHAPKAFTLAVLLIVILTKEILYRAVANVGANAKSTAIQTDAWHHRSDALTSAAAFIGITIALIGGHRFESADAWAALAACVIIAFNGFRLFRPALYELMDTAPPKESEAAVRNVAQTVAGVEAIDKCRIRKMGLEYYVDLHVRVDGSISVRDGHLIAHRVKDTLIHSNLSIADVLVHIEPFAEIGEPTPVDSD